MSPRTALVTGGNRGIGLEACRQLAAAGLRAVLTAAYGLSKAALHALTRQVAAEAGPRVLVNAMSPGWVATRMGGAGAPTSPAEAADTLVWLATLPDDGSTDGFFYERRPIPW